MISRLSGSVIEKGAHAIVLDVQGVGYEVLCTRAALERATSGAALTLVVFTDVKEESITLFGFADILERQVFLLLKRVKGVGSKTASEILSRVDKVELLRIIAVGDLAKLQQVRGIGRKTSERIVVELREKVAEYALEARASTLEIEVLADEPLRDALEALQSLGFSSKDAERAVRQAQAQVSPKDVGELIREALKHV